MKQFLKTFSNLVNFKVLLTVVMLALVLTPSSVLGATTTGTAKVEILASRDNVKISKTQMVESTNKTKIQNIEIINY